jgi:hypothetical protein
VHETVQAPVQGSLRAVLKSFDDNAIPLLRDGYPWLSPKANNEIQSRNPGAPCLVGWTLEQCSLGGTNSQLVHDANAANGVPSRYTHEFTSDQRSLGGTNAQANGNGYEFTFDDCSRGGTKFGGKKGKGGGNKPGCGAGSHSALRTKTETTQLNYLAYCASDAGKANFASRDINTAPDHYLKLLKLNPPLGFMNASWPNKARITLKKKQSKKSTP